VLGTAVTRELGLEGGDLDSESESAAPCYALDSLEQLAHQRRIAVVHRCEGHS
jgi:hypothetical protein